VLSYDGSKLTMLTSGTSNGLFSVTWSGNTATLVGNSGPMLTYSKGVFKTVVATGVTSTLEESLGNQHRDNKDLHPRLSLIMLHTQTERIRPYHGSV